MVGTQYQRGNTFERRVKEDLTSNGYHCWQSRGSKTPVDVLALKLGQILLVQCKTSGRFDSADWNLLYALAQDCGAVAVFADRPTLRRLRYRRLDGLMVPKSHTRLWTEFLVDEVVGSAGSS